MCYCEYAALLDLKTECHKLNEKPIIGLFSTRITRKFHVLYINIDYMTELLFIYLFIFAIYLTNMSVEQTAGLERRRAERLLTHYLELMWKETHVT
jgi:hypothetical protein